MQSKNKIAFTRKNLGLFCRVIVLFLLMYIFQAEPGTVYAVTPPEDNTAEAKLTNFSDFTTSIPLPFNAGIKSNMAVIQNRDPLVTMPPATKNYCWVPTYTVPGPIMRSPSIPPLPFLYQPFDMLWNGSGNIWSSNMDHEYPNYRTSNGVASLGEDLSGANLLHRYTSGNKNYDYYYSIAIYGEEFGYDGHDGHDFRTGGISGISALAAADGKVIEKVDYCPTKTGWGCYVLIYHPQGSGYLTRYAHLDSISVDLP
jgi:hypothetical protein